MDQIKTFKTEEDEIRKAKQDFKNSLIIFYAGIFIVFLFYILSGVYTWLASFYKF